MTRPFPERRSSDLVPALNLTYTDSLERIARSIGRKDNILINPADYEPYGGILHTRDLNKARDALDINCLDLMRLARYFGPAMARRAADGVNRATAWVNNLSIYAHMNLDRKSVV